MLADKLLHIIDFKYGQGILVQAEENPQMMLYALGALRLFDSLYDITEMSITVKEQRLITKVEISEKDLVGVELDDKAKRKLNSLRSLVENLPI